MPIIFNRPVAMTVLNQNIDSDLVFSDTAAFRSVRMNGRNSRLILQGGDGTAGSGGRITLTGQDFGVGDIAFVVPDALGLADINSCRIVGGSGYLDMNTMGIVGMANPAANQDAATKKYVDDNDDTHSTADRAYTDAKFPAWAVHDPVLTWGGATPTGVTKGMRWCKYGNVVFIAYMIAATDSKGTTSLTISLPAAASGTYNYHHQAFEGYGAGGGTYKDPLAYVGTTVSFLAFSAGTNGQPIYIQGGGIYGV